MKEFNFSPVTYNGLGQRRDNYFDNLRKGISTLASTPKNAYNRWYDEEENKRKWDNMLDEQRYRRERDQIADQRYNEEQARLAAERSARMRGMELNKRSMQDYFGAGGEQFDYDNEMSDLDNLQQDYEMGGVDNAPGVQYGREVNGARTRARNLVASPMDYETMQYTPGGYIGASNGSIAQRPQGDGNGQGFDLSRYGEGAMMAYSMMQNATNPEDYYAAQNHLFSIINQRNALDAQQGERENIRLANEADDKISSAIALHPVMSTVNRLGAGMPDKEYSPDEVKGMLNTLQQLEQYAMNIKDSAKRIEIQNKIDKAYANLSGIYSRKTAPGPRRK